MTGDNHYCKYVKSINKKTVNDKLKHKDDKNVLHNRSYMRYEMSRIQSKRS